MMKSGTLFVRQRVVSEMNALLMELELHLFRRIIMLHLDGAREADSYVSLRSKILEGQRYQ
jgi:hypothetical protein